MGFIVLEGDLTSGGEGFVPTSVAQNTSTGSSSRVFVNNIGVVCQGDIFDTHLDVYFALTGRSHAPVAGSSGSRVFVGPARKEVFTTLSSMQGECSDVVAISASMVIAGQ